MKRLVSLLVFAVVLLLATPAQALPVGPLARSRPYAWTVGGLPFTNIALNVPFTTDSLYVEGWNQIHISMVHTYSAASHVLMSCEESFDNSVWTWLPFSDESVAPYSDCTKRIWRWITGGAGLNWRWAIPIMGKYIRCSFSGTAADANDKLTSKVLGGVQ